MRRVVGLALASMLVVGLVGCGSKTETSPAEAAKNLGPAETVEQGVAQLREGDFVGLLQTSLPADRYAKIKADWKAKIAAEPATAEDKKEFADMMAKLTAADAETALYAELEPHLAKAEAEMAAQLPLMVGMGRGFAVQSINESSKLSPEQKQQASEFVDAFAKWVEGAKFFDRDKAKAAIAAAVKTARGLEITTLDQVEAMEFEQAMQKAGQVYLGLKDVLKVYELDLDAALASVDASVVKEAADQATVKVAYTLFGQPLSFETAMTKRDERWFGADALREIEAQLAAEQGAATPDAAADEGADGAAEDAAAETAEAGE
jgi:anthranilate/para-aminobenzoate synthase component I